mmetsp:Transcript_22109/g.46541  ORF Transcript_22109/g.46541 Transcript_22109/m.46541 type:complete len:229 (-) Transcript_22109:62-748(-)
MFHESTEGVSVSGDNDVLPGLELGDDGAFVVRSHALQGGFQTLGPFVGEVELRIPGIVARVMFAGTIDGGGRNIVGATPDEDLILPMLIHGLLLVQSLKSSVVAFVELPRLGGGDPHEVGFLEDVPEGADGAFLEGREGDVGDDSGFFDEFSGFDDFFVSFGREGDVYPTREFVFEVPGGFSVTDEDEGAFVGGLKGCKAAGIGGHPDRRTGGDGEGVSCGGEHGVYG